MGAVNGLKTMGIARDKIFDSNPGYRHSIAKCDPENGARRTSGLVNRKKWIRRAEMRATQFLWAGRQN